MSENAFRFTHAISRLPAKSIVDGLRAEDIGTPDHSVFVEHHATYVATLRAAGADVTVLDALEDFPDSVFVEDAALCLPEGAILMRPGAPSRAGEVAEIAPALRAAYGEVRSLPEGGFIEGGDILVTEREILVGLSERTDLAGCQALEAAVKDWGYVVRILKTPSGVLHFKTDCGLLDGETILSTERLSSSGCFEGYRVLHVAPGEEACANAVRFNDIVLMPDGFPRTRDLLLAKGFDVKCIGNSEAAKVDGGMSCLSLRFSPRG